MVGFASHLGCCANVVAELHALRMGLFLAWEEGYRDVIAEVDASLVLHLVKSANSSCHPLSSLIDDIRDLLNRNWRCLLQHSLREGNFSADCLAKLGCDLDVDYMVYREPPDVVRTACTQGRFDGNGFSQGIYSPVEFRV